VWPSMLMGCWNSAHGHYVEQARRWQSCKLYFIFITTIDAASVNFHNYNLNLNSGQNRGRHPDSELDGTLSDLDRISYVSGPYGNRFGRNASAGQH
jgi:hypothetical protein